jgi:hypothetical protein
MNSHEILTDLEQFGTKNKCSGTSLEAQSSEDESLESDADTGLDASIFSESTSIQSGDSFVSSINGENKTGHCVRIILVICSSLPSIFSFCRVAGGLFVSGKSYEKPAAH